MGVWHRRHLRFAYLSKTLQPLLQNYHLYFCSTRLHNTAILDYLLDNLRILWMGRRRHIDKALRIRRHIHVLAALTCDAIIVAEIQLKVNEKLLAGRIIYCCLPNFEQFFIF